MSESVVNAVNMEQKDENVNFYRRCKRRVRRSIGWS